MALKSGGVSVAEKRAELLAAGEEWPTCSCHGEPLCWGKSAQRKAGGSWQCAVKRRLTQAQACARYDRTEKGRVTTARRNARNNPKQIWIGRTYLGTTNQYPAPKEAVIAFARGLREESGLWPA